MHSRGSYLRSLTLNELWALQDEVNSELVQRLEDIEQQLRQGEGTTRLWPLRVTGRQRISYLNLTAGRYGPIGRPAERIARSF
jgi:hypothetical protein